MNFARFSISSLDGRTHSVQLYIDSTGEIAVNDATKEEVVWKRVENTSNMEVLLVGSNAQKVLGLAGDKVGINWGYFYLAAQQVRLLESLYDFFGTVLAVLSYFCRRRSFRAACRMPSSLETRLQKPVFCCHSEG